MDQSNCKTCRFWQDYTRRVYARISDKPNQHMAGAVWELRVCRYEAAPALKSDWYSVYTDENHSCSSWQSAK